MPTTTRPTVTQTIAALIRDELPSSHPHQLTVQETDMAAIVNDETTGYRVLVRMDDNSVRLVRMDRFSVIHAEATLTHVRAQAIAVLAVAMV